MTLAFLLALLAPAAAMAEPVVRAGVEWVVVAGDNGARTDEIVAAIVEGSISGAAVPFDAERTYSAPDAGPAVSRSRAPAARVPSAAGSASAAPAAPPTVAAGSSRRVLPAAAPGSAPTDAAAERGGTDESVVGFWLLIAAGTAGTLLLVGAGRRMRAPVRRR